MKNTLNLALYQSDIAWENPQENRDRIVYGLKELNSSTDVVLLPEMFASGFSLNVKQMAESMNGETICWLKEQARKHNIGIGGSLIIEEQNNFYNRFVFVFPEGELFYYDKKHLFTPLREHKVYTQGQNQCVIDFKGWKIGLYVCYDLRFPIWSRNRNKYDVSVFVANFPYERITAWDVLLKARAIENMSYSVGVNRVGVDKNRLAYNGHSAVYNSLGECISGELSCDEQIIYASLDAEFLKSHRQKFPILEEIDRC